VEIAQNGIVLIWLEVKWVQDDILIYHPIVQSFLWIAQVSNSITYAENKLFSLHS